jgi:ABC-type glycerol-3-phosphate transport system substrate-binding protein
MVDMQRRKLIGWSLPLLVNPASFAGSVCRESKYHADVNIVANSFPVIQHLAKVAKSCASDSLKVNVKLTSKVQNEVEIAFSSSGKSPFDAAVVSASVFNDLYSKNQLYSLKGLVSKFKDHHKIEEKMIVRMNGEPMAIAFMQNTQVLYYRRDILKRLGLSVPKTYDEMFATAAIIKKLEPAIANPIAQCFAKGWDLATEFTNVNSSLGGRFFKEGTALPAFNSEHGVQAIELMRKMLPYMSPNALASNADDVMNQLQQGRAAMGVLWASRASRMDDPAASKVVGLIDFAPAPAARVGGGTAAHLWWDGVVMPRNGLNQRDATFSVLMEMLSESAVESGNDLAIWVRSNFKPGRASTGVQLAMEAGAKIWPAEPFFNLAHLQLGKVLADAVKGLRDPAQALAGAAEAYKQSAIEKSFLKRDLT